MTRSPLCDSSGVPVLLGEHKDSNNFKTEGGRWGTSPSNLLKDLSDAGNETFNVSACSSRKNYTAKLTTPNTGGEICTK